MKYADALNATLKHFEITAREVSLKSGVTESSISRYRRGERDIQVESLERMLDVLPPEARYYFYCDCLIKDLDATGVAMLLQAIAAKMRADAESSDASTVLMLTSQ